MTALATKTRNPAIRRRLRCRRCQAVLGYWIWTKSGPATGRLEYNAQDSGDGRTCRRCARSGGPS